MLRTEEKTIGEFTYAVTQLNAIKGRNAFLRFAKLVAPALEEVTGGDTDKGVSKEKFMSAIAAVANRATEEDLAFFCDVFAATTDVVMVDSTSGKTTKPKLSAIYLLHFAGDRLPEMFEWLAFCFEVNFGSFFAKLGVTRATSGAPTIESK